MGVDNGGAGGAFAPPVFDEVKISEVRPKVAMVTKKLIIQDAYTCHIICPPSFKTCLHPCLGLKSTKVVNTSHAI